MTTLDKNMALTGQPPKALAPKQRLATLIGLAGLFILLLASFGIQFPNKGLWLTLSLLSIFVGVSWFTVLSYQQKTKGIKNDGVWFKSVSSMGFWGWIAGIAITGFYIILYFSPEMSSVFQANLVHIPLSRIA